jgi:DNA-binding transcriptional ArsR family regulator
MRKRGGGAGCGPARECGAALGELLSPRLFKALCDPSRLQLLVRLCEACAPRTVSELAGCCPINLSVVSRHLAQLRDAGILAAERKGKEVFYRVRFRELAQSLRALADAIERCCPDGACATKGESR